MLLAMGDSFFLYGIFFNLMPGFNRFRVPARFTLGNAGRNILRGPGINNWDLVDLSAPQIVGGSLAVGDRGFLETLAESPLLWERRIAVLATFTAYSELPVISMMLPVASTSL